MPGEPEGCPLGMNPFLRRRSAKAHPPEKAKVAQPPTAQRSPPNEPSLAAPLRARRGPRGSGGEVCSPHSSQKRRHRLSERLRLLQERKVPRTLHRHQPRLPQLAQRLLRHAQRHLGVRRSPDQ